jgi:hypothetical protein
MRLLNYLAALLVASSIARAHEMPKSAVLLDLRSNHVEMELRLPIDRLQIALQHDGTGDPTPAAATLTDAARDRVEGYILGHIQATAPSGAPWSDRLLDLDRQQLDGNDDLIVHLSLTPPPGIPTNVFRLHYDVVTRELVTHGVLVSMRTDWRNGVSAGSPELLGPMSVRRTDMLIDRSSGSAWQGFRRIFRLGLDHIAEGTDHLLFLLTLLLPAPLLASGGRWHRTGTVGRSARRIAAIVTAFTVGHSLTLMLGALEIVQVPEPPIEVLIAASILVSAIHALRPIFPGREYLVAGFFGLIHGLAFATVIGELGLDRWALAGGIFGFNLGIETMQLAVVMATFPWLMILSTTGAYALFRIAGAGFAAVAAVGWMADRALGWSNPIDPAVDMLAAHSGWLVAGLAAASILGKALQMLARPRGPGSIEGQLMPEGR